MWPNEIINNMVRNISFHSCKENRDFRNVKMNFRNINAVITPFMISKALSRIGILPNYVYSLYLVGGEYAKECFSGRVKVDGEKGETYSELGFTNLNNLKIQDVKAIKEGMFSYTPLEYVECDTSLEKIEEYAFAMTPMLDKCDFVFKKDGKEVNNWKNVNVDILAFDDSGTDLTQHAINSVDWKEIF